MRGQDTDQEEVLRGQLLESRWAEAKNAHVREKRSGFDEEIWTLREGGQERWTTMMMSWHGGQPVGWIALD